jgi:hypothetical protein
LPTRQPLGPIESAKRVSKNLVGRQRARAREFFKKDPHLAARKRGLVSRLSYCIIVESSQKREVAGLAMTSSADSAVAALAAHQYLEGGVWRV